MTLREGPTQGTIASRRTIEDTATLGMSAHIISMARTAGTAPDDASISDHTDALEDFTGSREMSGKAILACFAPLQACLKERNRGKSCGW